VEASRLYKLMMDVARVPKPWEQQHSQWEALRVFAEGTPESTADCLLPLVWHVRDRLAYMDGGGLNGYLKEHGLSKAGWKRLLALTVEDTAALYHAYQSQRDWLTGLPAVIKLCADASADLSANAIRVLMDVPLQQLDELPGVFRRERYLLVRKVAEHSKQLNTDAEIADFRQQLLIIVDWLDCESFAIDEGITIEQLRVNAEAWHARLQDVELGSPAPLEDESQVALTPGGQDIFDDLASGLQVVRLSRWDDFVAESAVMSNCIGLSHTYFNRHIAGRGAFYSLRQPGRDRPVATIELIKPRDEWIVQQCLGFANQSTVPPAGHALAARLAEAHNLGGENLSSELRFEGRGDVLDDYQLNNSSPRYF